ncbi:MAG: ImmA/IrrE family metallo-endopeptidase [Rhodospirillaceae bacterium]|nr:ImmA/IrrE family metallo-endopeptidase [Rhodospirillaceae bacterium]
MNTKIIRTDDEYHDALKDVERLMLRSDSLSVEETNKLEVLTILIEAFENSKYPVEPADPVDAILFRMEEKGLKQADLIPYFGTSGRVSEILRRKRPLTVQMIRALSVGLGISAETLIGLGDVTPTQDREVDWSKFPIKEMMARGWIDRLTGSVREHREGLVKNYITGAGLNLGIASFRRSLSGEAQSPTTVYAIFAWLARVIQRARSLKPKLGTFEKARISSSFLKELAHMSWSEKGPMLAIEYLQMNGICVIVEPHLKGTQLDGAALRDIDGTPIIGLTLRFDRLDNFWFTLLHEVAHIWKHVDNDIDTFVDDLKVLSEDRREAEANRLASEALIPRLVWKRSGAYLSPSKYTVEELARELRIHPAIIVGRLHKETGNYALLNSMVGHNQVRKMLLA